MRVLLIGQGISGTLLYHSLTKAGVECLVVDAHKTNSASRVAAGLINPVTGRRLVKTWMIDELLPVAQSIYGELEKKYDTKFLQEHSLTWFFPAPDILQAYEKRIAEGTDFINDHSSDEMETYFNFPFRYGNIEPCYILDINQLLDFTRQELIQDNRLHSTDFYHPDLEILPDGVRYGSIEADKIIFCEGSAGTNNPWFGKLPYSLNKGEALILSIKELPRRIYKYRQTLVPLPGEADLWWYGSNYTWEFEDDKPTGSYRDQSEMELRHWLKVPFIITDHKSAVRYSTVERRPFIGFHPEYSPIGIFNGWGTKGCSLTPFFASHFTDHIIKKIPLMPEVNVSRYSRLLLANTKSF